VTGSKSSEQLEKVEYNKVIDQTRYLPDSLAKIKMGEVVRLISEISNGEAIVVIRCRPASDGDVKILQIQKSQIHIITSGGLGTMGFALARSNGCTGWSER
jgi:thiamine pyrophosphate-dependent acetolactate synthase large subunit-like protein